MYLYCVFVELYCFLVLFKILERRYKVEKEGKGEERRERERCVGKAESRLVGF